jgi:3-oxoadipate enol-lactonase
MTEPVPLRLPWLPTGRTVLLADRGEVFVRWHRHEDPTRPTVLLLHGWTASADLQFFTAYEAIAERCSFVAIDHRGHGRGLRTPEPFSLESVADDAAATVRELGIRSVITVGYSMGGPISLLLAHRHPDLVDGVIVQATAFEWNTSLAERVRWKTIRLLGPLLRSWAYPRWLRAGIARLLGADHTLLPYVPWLAAETRRNDAHTVVQAGRALSGFDARGWVKDLRVPAGALVMCRDRLVPPRRQRELAAALDAHVEELDADHLGAWEAPGAYSTATCALIDRVTTSLAARPAAEV